MHPDDILDTYAQNARGFAKHRSKILYERKWLDRTLAHAPGRRVLDLGCGSGDPIARYLNDRRAHVTGVDGAAEMITLFQQTLPEAQAIHADMRGLNLGREFDIILAWNSFFHLGPADQRAMFPTFANHAAPGAVLLFTSGPEESEVIGEVEGAPVYHSSFDPKEYRALLGAAEFEVLKYVPEDPDCAGHTVWLARKVAIA